MMWPFFCFSRSAPRNDNLFGLYQFTGFDKLVLFNYP